MFCLLVLVKERQSLETYTAHLCNVCGKVFTMHANLDSNVTTHFEEKTYFCHTCCVHFPQYAALIKHSGIHANDRPHQSSVCNKRFFTQSALKFHYTCANFQKSLTGRGQFMQHLMIYCGKKSFVCLVSGKSSLGRSVWRHTLDCTLVRNFPLSFCWKFHQETHHQALHKNLKNKSYLY